MNHLPQITILEKPKKRPGSQLPCVETSLAFPAPASPLLKGEWKKERDAGRRNARSFIPACKFARYLISRALYGARRARSDWKRRRRMDLLKSTVFWYLCSKANEERKVNATGTPGNDSSSSPPRRTYVCKWASHIEGDQAGVLRSACIV